MNNATHTVIKSQDTDPLSFMDLAEEFQRLQHEYDGICGEKFEEAIQRTLLEQRKVFIDHLESMYSEIADNCNQKIRETNTKFGLTLPLEESKKVSASDIAEHDQQFIAHERERADVQKKHLTERLKEVKLQISSVLGITAAADPSSLTRPIKSPDDKVAIAQLLEDNRSLQNELEDLKKSVIKLEAEKEQDKITIAKLQTLNHEIRHETTTLKEKFPYYKVVATSCSRVHHGFFHAGRRFCDDDGYHDIEGRAPADRMVNDARNDECHKGGIEADYALFIVDLDRTGWNIGGERYVDFTNSYGFTPHQWAKICSLSETGPDRVLLEIPNMHATMYRCYFNTAHSHNKVEVDEAFNVLYAKFHDVYKGLLASTNLFLSGKRYQNFLIVFRQSPHHRSETRKIVRRTVAFEKARCSNRA
ncbi:hypothetical protein EAE96_007901 [Botrytis aclada]|nr:hypothetical protein EAE96_007901 [Botrytis aclada]